MMRRGLLATAVVALVATAACGGEPAELSGFRRDPAPDVGQFSLPDLADDGAEFPLRADDGELLVVYFGYTNCPDFCPTTLSDLKLAMQRLDGGDAERVDVAMATVDPNRDLPVLVDYIQSFFEDGHALGTDDDQRLAEVAAPFGVSYDIQETADGTEVAHTTFLYAVDDQGELVLTWQFGVSIDDLKTDLEVLLEEVDTA